MKPASLRKPLFGKEAEIAVWGIEEGLAGGVLEDAYERGRQLERIFNFYDRKSVLSVLNRKRRVKAPEELLLVIKKALELCQRTGGRYDISLGRQFLARKGGKEAAPAGCSYKDIRIEDGAIVLTNDEVMVDLGSIAKGYIADEMASSLMADGVLDGLVDARGDIRTFGSERMIGVQHPRGQGDLCMLRLGDAGVATSGDYNQFSGSFERPHILNSRDYISVTTIAGTLMEADGYATAVFVTPRDEVRALLHGTGIKAMCVRKDMGIEYHNGFEGCIA